MSLESNSSSNPDPVKWSAKKSVDHTRKRIPSYCVHKRQNHAFVRLTWRTPNGLIPRSFPLGKAYTPDSYALYDQVLKWYADNFIGPDTDLKKLKREW